MVDDSKASQALQQQLEALRRENALLQGEVTALKGAASEPGIQICYLNKFHASAQPLWASAWATRYAVLSGHHVSLYRNEKDTAFFPRASIDVLGCCIEEEGLKRSKFYTFSICTASGALVLRLSTNKEATYKQWVNAFLQCGCHRSDSKTRRAAAAVASLRKGHGSSGSLSSLMDRALGRGSSAQPPNLARCSDSSDASEQSVQVATGGRSTRRPAAWQNVAKKQPPADSAPQAGAGAAVERSMSWQDLQALDALASVPASPTTGTCQVPASPTRATPRAGSRGLPRGPSAASLSEISEAESDAPSKRAARRSGDSAASERDGTVAAPGVRAPGSSRPNKQAPVRASMLPSTPVHTKHAFSYLSSERISYQQHSGLINLGMRSQCGALAVCSPLALLQIDDGAESEGEVIILAANSRLILENIIKYGVRADPVRWFQSALSSSASSNRGILVAFLALALCAPLAFALEAFAVTRLRLESRLQAAARKRPDDRNAQALAKRAPKRTEACLWAGHALVSAVLPLLIPIVMTILMENVPPLPASALTLSAITLWAKLISYAHCNWDLRMAARANEFRSGERGTVLRPAVPGALPFEPQVSYPENITLRNLGFFVAVPTLTYQARKCVQLEYPRTASIRPRWILRRVLELIAYCGLMLFIIEQYIGPGIANSLAPMRQSHLPRVLERVLKLSLPCMYVWLCVFYTFFHLWLNILAELTRFGDREFYKDWWNATTIGEYWKLWNMPVHRWMLRTIYYPLIRNGYSRFVAGFSVFFISALMHELAVGVPLGMVRYWAFTGMLFQLPLVHVCEMLHKKLNNEQLGNMLFWLVFCIVGQPMCALLYYHDYVLLHSPGLGSDGGAATDTGAAVAAEVTTAL